MNDRLVCVCGEPIKPCPVPLEPSARWMCAGYIHMPTQAHPQAAYTHQCRGRDGVAEPREATVPP